MAEGGGLVGAVAHLAHTKGAVNVVVDEVDVDVDLVRLWDGQLFNKWPISL